MYASVTTHCYCTSLWLSYAFFQLPDEDDIDTVMCTRQSPTYFCLSER